MKTLKLWQTYTREQVHDIFSPDTTFTPQSGSWGLHGIVRLPEGPNSFVFFVTFGRVQGEYAFDESITEDGVLSWQSQPQQRLDSPIVKSLIEHDDRCETIHLFLRTRARAPYTYMGPLAYLTHDGDREQPVHFQWQLLGWPVPRETIRYMGLQLIATGEPPSPATSPPQDI
ncbi:DUF3427 domain-containing protein [Geodermatophilus dictyosporus]|uniref:DUF3427 domain-containing protein n=1 Tax=Geodermatophilus dictyosporus TaxID=1523247 RepID=UPI000B87507B|nr:DUF3427 domain-containing protein [Geodermatophilus dictyosporus]